MYVSTVRKRSDGNILVSGNFIGTTDFNPGTGERLLTSQDSFDFFILSLDSIGEFDWVAQIEGIPYPEDLAICPDLNNNVFATGFISNNTQFIVGADTITHSSLSLWRDAFVLKIGNCIVQPPIPSILELPDVTGQCSVYPIAPTATNGCDSMFTGTTSTVFPIADQGETVITWSYEDGFGNVFEQNQNIVVNDVTNPVTDALELEHIVSDCPISLDDIEVPTATDNCTGIISGTTTTSFPISTPGTHTIIWVFDDGNGNGTSQLQQVTIEEDITDPSPNTVQLYPIFPVCELSEDAVNVPAAIDNCAGTIYGTPNVSFPLTDHSVEYIIWTYDDGNGNLVSQLQAINWLPEIELGLTIVDDHIISNQEDGIFQWVDCSNDNAPIEGETSQVFTPESNGNYAVEITVDGCTRLSECISYKSLGLLSAGDDLFHVFPNPSSGEYIIKFNEEIKDVELTITDLLGRQVSKELVRDQTSMNVYLEEDPGIYLLTLRTSKSKSTITLIKE